MKQGVKNSMAIKYFYIEDNTAALFAANGTGLTAALIGVTNIIPITKVPISTIPLWIFFLGLIFAFLSKGIIQILNDDTVQREKLQNARDLVLSAKTEPNLTSENTAGLEVQWRALEARHGSLLKIQHVEGLVKVRALCFFYLP